MSDVSDLRATEALRPGDECEFRRPARQTWGPGIVRFNGGASYWTVEDARSRKLVSGLYIEHVRAPGTDPWGQPSIPTTETP